MYRKIHRWPDEPDATAADGDEPRDVGRDRLDIDFLEPIPRRTPPAPDDGDDQ